MKPFTDEVNEVLVHYHDVARAHGMDRALREAVEAEVFTRRECAGLRRRVEELQRQLAGEEVEVLDFLWQEYVQADPATLTKDAKELAERVRQKVRVLAGVERLEAECDALRARLAEAEADAGAIEWLQAECEALRARVASLEAEVERHRERANAAQLAWEGHQASDCAIKCAREIEALLGTNDLVQAARVIKTLQTERDELKSDLLELAEAVWLQWGFILSDGRRDAGCVGVLKHVEDILRRYGRIDERGRFAWEEAERDARAEAR